ncbi:AraC family transcriptional regulator [Dysosmobacter sp. Phy]
MNMDRLSDTFYRCVYSDAVTNRQNEVHDSFEIAFLRKGSVHARVADRDYTAGPGSLFIISRYESHAFWPLEGTYERYYVWISDKIMDQIPYAGKILSVFRNRNSRFSHCIEMGPYAPAVDFAMSQMVYEYKNPTPFSLELMLSYFMTILYYCNRVCPQNFSLESASKQASIYKIQRYIEEHYEENIKMSELAAQNHFDPSYLSRFFKKSTGFSLKQYQLFVRMSRARMMLICSDCSVESIAARCGYSDVNIFIRTFKKEHNITPLQYRKRERG